MNVHNSCTSGLIRQGHNVVKNVGVKNDGLTMQGHNVARYVRVKMTP